MDVSVNSLQCANRGHGSTSAPAPRHRMERVAGGNGERVRQFVFGWQRPLAHRPVPPGSSGRRVADRHGRMRNARNVEERTKPDQVNQTESGSDQIKANQGKSSLEKPGRGAKGSGSWNHNLMKPKLINSFGRVRVGCDGLSGALPGRVPLGWRDQGRRPLGAVLPLANFLGPQGTDPTADFTLNFTTQYIQPQRITLNQFKVLTMRNLRKTKESRVNAAIQFEFLTMRNLKKGKTLCHV